MTSRATYFINNVDWTHGLVKRPGQIHVHTHQGTPLGTWASTCWAARPRDTTSMSAPTLRRADRWDFSLVSSPYAQQIWDRAYPCHFTSIPTGAPRNDVLVRGDALRTVALRERLGVPGGNTVALDAPTWRGHRKSYVPRLDLEHLVRELGPTVTLLVRLHPRDAKAEIRGLQLRDLQRRGLLLDVTDEPSVQDMMLVSDALLTDYSSLMFDYANTDRPIIVHGDDWAAYQAARGAYFDLAEPPGHVSTSTDELTDLFASGAWQDARSAALRAAFRRRFCAYDDGHAAARVVSLIMLGREYPPSLHSPAGRTTARRRRAPRSPGRHTMTTAAATAQSFSAPPALPLRSARPGDLWPCQTPGPRSSARPSVGGGEGPGSVVARTVGAAVCPLVVFLSCQACYLLWWMAFYPGLIDYDALRLHLAGHHRPLDLQSLGPLQLPALAVPQHHWGLRGR